MLAGDAMQALAFEVLTPDATDGGRCARAAGPALWLLARAAGHAGMAGGQAIDLASDRQAADEACCATCTAARPAPCCKAAC
jgi:farnesyl diphosphate synthase